MSKKPKQNNQGQDSQEIVDKSVELMNNEESGVNSKNLKGSRTLTMGEFLATSREIKQKYNSYVAVGFCSYYETLRRKDTSVPYRRTYEDWMSVFVCYAKS